ncbi:MAG: hypothetical protein FWG50_02055 [Kiritimatiellaeota bacterium]|nr:hypothetical protein [Kiritimatiellota bacterium]
MNTAKRKQIKTVLAILGLPVILGVTVIGYIFFPIMDEGRNEVVKLILQYEAEGENITYIEQASISADEVTIVDVHVESRPFITQAYRIGNRKILSCQWSGRVPNEYKNAHGGDETYWSKLTALWDTFRELPNRLAQDNACRQPATNGVTVTTMGWAQGLPASSDSGFAVWYPWTVRQWSCSPDEVPEAIGAFLKSIAQAVSKPEYAKHYRAYLRAVPLFTEADLELVKDVPLIDLAQTRYHAQRAIHHPYILFPVPEQRTPFPNVPEYRHGDKFKVRAGDNYFLIETFRGSSKGQTF